MGTQKSDGNYLDTNEWKFATHRSLFSLSVLNVASAAYLRQGAHPARHRVALLRLTRAVGASYVCKERTTAA